MTESRKSVEEDSKANQSHAMQVSKEQPPPGGDVQRTGRSQWNCSNDRHEYGRNAAR